MNRGIGKQKKSLGRMLLEEGLLTQEQLDKALETQKQSGEPLGKVLVRLGWIEERDILRALEGLMVVIFSLEGEEFGIETLYVREIIRANSRDSRACTSSVFNMR